MFLKRIAAILYDSLIIACIFILGTSIVVLLNKANMISPDNYYFKAYLFLIYMSYFIFFWTKCGQTIGMSAWKLQVVTLENKRLNIKTSTIRFLVAIPCILLGGVGIIWSLFERSQQSLYEKITKTKLINIT